MLYQIARAMTEGEHVCCIRGRGYNSAMHFQCMSDLCRKFQIAASNTVRGFAEIQIVTHNNVEGT